MALENLEPATRIESILDGEDIAPATRLEYFLKKASAGGGGGGGGEQSILFASIIDDGGTMKLDKTWLECKNADAVIIRTVSDPDVDIAYVSRITMSEGTPPESNTYEIISVFPDLGGPDGVAWMPLVLSTDTETGYPELQVQ